ncbi:hypothetical protein BRD17_07285 [Halobacteriales archaeon SW_7_68_16]|nr:MAG: hypothetical protein BRD17_07285 [Halobacteriales archaeon SW_7_68_16]
MSVPAPSESGPSPVTPSPAVSSPAVSSPAVPSPVVPSVGSVRGGVVASPSLPASVAVGRSASGVDSTGTSSSPESGDGASVTFVRWPIAGKPLSFGVVAGSRASVEV